MVSEPLRWKLQFGKRTGVASTESLLRSAAIGPFADVSQPPGWLLPFQVEAMCRICASIEIFRGALLSDAVGLGKTYVSLAVATRYRSAAVAVPAALLSQWSRVSARLGVAIELVTHEALSRGAELPTSELIIVDEAHRFRNPNTRRYEHLSRGLRRSHLLLLTATPVVNRASDLVHLLRLFVSDSSFALLGLASLDGALSKRDYQQLARSTSVAIVARSAHSIDSMTARIPRVKDSAVIRAGSASPNTLQALLAVVDSLKFPNFIESQDYALLRLHLLHRLASSTVAFRDTVRRHLAYTERALSALERGENLSRTTARRVFSTEDELQFELNDLSHPASTTSVRPGVLRSDRGRLQRILGLLHKINGSSPKSEALARILQSRSGQKTIVFTTAVATALDLARRLEWKEVAVVGAGRSWIASGQLPIDETLGLFAPKARELSEPPRSMLVSTLIATDLASEGLDLQDADAVVHYDLPWTPLKLEQRVGRIARLGSAFRFAEVHWFAPPAALDRRLRLQSRISEKVDDQIELNVAATSRVGRARVVNETLEQRERIGRCLFTGNRQSPCFAVVRGPRSAAVAIRWFSGKAPVPELITLGGHSLREFSDIAAIEKVLSGLLASPPSQADPPSELIDHLLRIVRERLTIADGSTHDQQSRRFAKRVLRTAYAAGRRRDRNMVAVLDAVLSRLSCGLSVGGERTLAEVLHGDSSDRDLREWLDEQPEVQTACPTFEVVAALFGDGSRESEV